MRLQMSFVKGLAHALALLLFVMCGTGQARAGEVCTLIIDAATGQIVLEQGACDTRMTPASTFKIPLAMTGFDAGILQDANTPVLPYRKGEPAWGGANWTRNTNPRDWIRFSVVWYSQRITRQLGATELERYLRALNYGNADVSGDAGQGNGLERAWLSSSLQISPREQVRFLRRLVNQDLPVSKAALAMTRSIVPSQMAGDWRVFGKTGGAYQRGKDGALDYDRGIGWYVGWALKAERTLVFARLTVLEARTDRSPGILTREALLAQWPDLIAR